MRRKGLVLVAAFAALAAVASASSHAPSVAVPQAVKGPSKGGVLLAVAPGARGPVLGRADKRALWIARNSPRLRIFNQLAAWAYAADRERLALATVRESSTSEPVATLQLIHSFSLQRFGLTKLGAGYVPALTWGSSGVNVVLDRFCCPGRFEVVTVDPGSGKIVSRVRLANTLQQWARVGSTLVLLAGPATGIGTATLFVVDPDGGIRTVALDPIIAGREQPEEGEAGPDFTRFRQNVPGLAVDPGTARAFVVPASGVIAQVSLATLAVSYHAVAEPISLFGRVHNWLEPKSAAKGMNGPIRNARWLGSGVLAVSGADETMAKDANGEPRMSWTPAGLKLIDTNSWGSKVIDRGADSFAVDGATLLATGARWDNREGKATGMGLASYGFDGERKLWVLGGQPLSLVLSFRGRAYVDAGGRNGLRVVDLARGDVTKRRAPLAQLLIGEASS